MHLFLTIQHLDDDLRTIFVESSLRPSTFCRLWPRVITTICDLISKARFPQLCHLFPTALALCSLHPRTYRTYSCSSPLYKHFFYYRRRPLSRGHFMTPASLLRVRKFDASCYSKLLFRDFFCQLTKTQCRVYDPVTLKSQPLRSLYLCFTACSLRPYTRFIFDLAPIYAGHNEHRSLQAT